MSAYALPGLFPPLKVTKASCEDGNGSSTESSEPTAQFAQHESLEMNTPVSTGTLHPAANTLLLSHALSAGLKFGSPNSSRSSSRSSSSASIRDLLKTEEHGIAVKEAKIDPVKLLQSAKATSKWQQPQMQPRRTLRKRGSRELLTDAAQQNSGSKESSTQKEQSTDTATGGRTPHDEAIEFELSISFNGRKYTATRTLQRIFQFRDDLVHEMETRRRWLQFRSAGSSSHLSETDEEDELDMEDEVEIKIPEIPPMNGEKSSNGPIVGFVGRGFTLLHAMATSYVPVMEGWLRNIMAIVPQDSECLTNFLWEPLSSGETALVDPSFKSCTSLANLGSIKERGYHTEDSDFEDTDEHEDW